MYMHPETYRLLTSERINGYLGEAAARRRIRAAAAAVAREPRDSHPILTAAGRLLRAVVRVLTPSGRERRAA